MIFVSVFFQQFNINTMNKILHQKTVFPLGTPNKYVAYFAYGVQTRTGARVGMDKVRACIYLHLHEKSICTFYVSNFSHFEKWTMAKQ